jgi:hypothetical protein
LREWLARKKRFTKARNLGKGILIPPSAYTRGPPDSSAVPGKHNPAYNAMAEEQFYWNGDYRNVGDIIIESKA